MYARGIAVGVGIAVSVLTDYDRRDLAIIRKRDNHQCLQEGSLLRDSQLKSAHSCRPCLLSLAHLEQRSPLQYGLGEVECCQQVDKCRCFLQVQLGMMLGCKRYDQHAEERESGQKLES